MKPSCPLTQHEIDEIVKIIQKQLFRYQQREKQYPNLFYDSYLAYRKQHEITAVILSGFTPETNTENFDIDLVFYGKGKKMAQPELKNQNIILHICNIDCGFSSLPYKDNCTRYNTDLLSKPIFGCIIFSVNQYGILKSISLKIPNADGKFTQTNWNLYKRSNSEKAKHA